ncbi:MAG: PHP domain-containing protein [Candidatus Coatesbacteria bacterium]
MGFDPLFAALNGASRAGRLAAVRRVGKLIADGRETAPGTEETNNHVHTRYSFSPYFPTAAAWLARRAGLRVVGIMDHDSVAGAGEMIEACRRLGIACTVGFEMRVNMTGTAVEGRKTNHPDARNISYMSFHGIPHGRLAEAERFLKPFREARNRRNRWMVTALDAMMARHRIGRVSYREVEALSQAREGGSVTERHLLLALARALIRKAGRGARLVRLLGANLGVEPPRRLRAYLLDPANPHYDYDLLGVLKSSVLDRFAIDPDETECPSVYDAVKTANAMQSLPVYPYLGDVADSPTGDKKAEAFEDSYLDRLVPELKRIGFRGLAYMPPRNTRAQLRRVSRLARGQGLIEISGVDINSSRQSFNCPILLDPAFRHLVDTTWALVAHELLASRNERYALFSPRNPMYRRPLGARLAAYARIGKRIDPRHPERAIGIMKEVLG